MFYSKNSLKFFLASLALVNSLSSFASPPPPPPLPDNFGIPIPPPLDNFGFGPANNKTIINSDESLYKLFDKLSFETKSGNKARIKLEATKSTSHSSTGNSKKQENSSATGTSLAQQAMETLQKRRQNLNGEAEMTSYQAPVAQTLDEKITNLQEILVTLQNSTEPLAETMIDKVNKEETFLEISFESGTSLQEYMKHITIDQINEIFANIKKVPKEGTRTPEEAKIVMKFDEIFRLFHKLNDVDTENKALIKVNARKAAAEARKQDPKYQRKLAQEKAELEQRRGQNKEKTIESKREQYNKIIQEAREANNLLGQHLKASEAARDVLVAEGKPIDKKRPPALTEMEFKRFIKGGSPIEASDFFAARTARSSELQKFNRDYNQQVKNLISNSLRLEDLQKVNSAIQPLDQNGNLGIIGDIIQELSVKKEEKPRSSGNRAGMFAEIEKFKHSKLKKVVTKESSVLTAKSEEIILENDLLAKARSNAPEEESNWDQEDLSEIETALPAETVAQQIARLNGSDKKSSEQTEKPRGASDRGAYLAKLREIRKNAVSTTQDISLDSAKTNATFAYYSLLAEGRKLIAIKESLETSEKHKLDGDDETHSEHKTFLETLTPKISLAKFNHCLKYNILPTAEEIYGQNVSDKVQFILKKSSEDLAKVNAKEILLEIATRNPDGVDAFSLLLEQFDKKLGESAKEALSSEELRLLEEIDIYLNGLSEEEAKANTAERKKLNQQARENLQKAKLNREKGGAYKPNIEASLQANNLIRKKSVTSTKIDTATKTATTSSSDQTETGSTESNIIGAPGSDQIKTESTESHNTDMPGAEHAREGKSIQSSASSSARQNLRNTQTKIDHSSMIANITNILVSNIIEQRTNSPAASGDAEYQPTNYGWISGIAGVERQNTNKNIAGYRSKSVGFSAGAEFMFKDNLFLGGAYSYINSNFALDKEHKANNLAVHSNILSLYGKFIINKDLSLDGQISCNHAYLNDKMENGKKQQITANNFNLQGKLAYTIYNEESILIRPFIKMTYSNLSFSEPSKLDINSLNIKLAKQNKHNTSLALGSRFTYEQNLSNEFKVTYGLNLAGEKFIEAKDKPSVAGVAGVDAIIAKDKFLVKIEYNLHLKKDYLGQQGSLQLKWLF